MDGEGFLIELDVLLEETDLGELEDLDSDTLDELIPELVVLCANTWALELVIAYCKARRPAHAAGT